MEKNIVQIFEAEILDDEFNLSLREISTQTNLSIEYIIEMIDHGVIEPTGTNYNDWRFTGETFARVMKAHRLRRDFNLNLQALGLVLEMLDELQELRAQLHLVNKDI